MRLKRFQKDFSTNDEEPIPKQVSTATSKPESAPDSKASKQTPQTSTLKDRVNKVIDNAPPPISEDDILSSAESDIGEPEETEEAEESGGGEDSKDGGADTDNDADDDDDDDDDDEEENDDDDKDTEVQSESPSKTKDTDKAVIKTPSKQKTKSSK